MQELYSKYFQKSKVFCFPLLEIKNPEFINTTSTFLSWPGEYLPEDGKLICQYDKWANSYLNPTDLRELDLHSKYERKFQVSEKSTIYVFDMSEYFLDWLWILNGKYSKLSVEYKRKVILHFARNPMQANVIRKILYPAKHYAEFASLIDVPVSIVREVGEVLDPPNFEKEQIILENKLFSIHKGLFQ